MHSIRHVKIASAKRKAATRLRVVKKIARRRTSTATVNRAYVDRYVTAMNVLSVIKQDEIEAVQANTDPILAGNN
jgi:hypothetical protein